MPKSTNSSQMKSSKKSSKKTNKPAEPVMETPHGVVSVVEDTTQLDT